MNDKDLSEHLKQLLRAPGLSAFEAPVRELVAAAWKPYAPKQTVSRLGSLHALQPGTGRSPRPKILLAAHMDMVGLMVTQVEEGFCRITEIGGLDARILPGQMVVIHGREDVPATVVMPPAALLPPDRKAEIPRLRDLWLDTGLPEADAARLIRTGDTAAFFQPPLELAGGRIAGRSLDDRASVAALTVCLAELAVRPHAWDVIAAATVQEEETLGGAATSSFALRPDIAIAVDVTFGAAPGLPEHKTFPLGEGPTIGLGPNVHPGVQRWMVQAAAQAGIQIRARGDAGDVGNRRDCDADFRRGNPHRRAWHPAAFDAHRGGNRRAGGYPSRRSIAGRGDLRARRQIPAQPAMGVGGWPLTGSEKPRLRNPLRGN